MGQGSSSSKQGIRAQVMQPGENGNSARASFKEGVKSTDNITLCEEKQSQINVFYQDATSTASTSTKRLLQSSTATFTVSTTSSDYSDASSAVFMMNQLFAVIFIAASSLILVI